MPYDPERHHRRSIRLKGYDYGQPGLYFVTICTHERECLFGQIIEGDMHPNESGLIVGQCWSELPLHYPNISLDAFVLMPNHVHGIIELCAEQDRVGAGLQTRPGNTVKLPEIVRGFKTYSARRINDAQNSTGTPIWQRGFFDHIIRHEQSLAAIRAYILHNPAHWTTDRDHP